MGHKQTAVNIHVSPVPFSSSLPSLSYVGNVQSVTVLFLTQNPLKAFIMLLQIFI